MRLRRVFFTLSAVAVVLLGCQATSTPMTVTSPLPTLSVIQSPVATPVPTTVSGPVFEIDEPVYAGAVTVTGTGPADVPIKLVDVSEVGAELATTTIEKDGGFSFQLPVPLVEGHTVGLQIGDLSGTSFSYGEFSQGDTYYDRPLIGILLDMVSVKAAP